VQSAAAQITLIEHSMPHLETPSGYAPVTHQQPPDILTLEIYITALMMSSKNSVAVSFMSINRQIPK